MVLTHNGEKRLKKRGKEAKLFGLRVYVHLQIFSKEEIMRELKFRLDPDCAKDADVIGNIHENPELLEKK